MIQTMCLAAPARVIEASEKTAVVDYGGVRATVRLDALPEEISPGDYVLIHTGFAIRRLSAADAEQTLRLFDELAASLASDQAPPSNGSTASPATGAGQSRADEHHKR